MGVEQEASSQLLRMGWMQSLAWAEPALAPVSAGMLSGGRTFTCRFDVWPRVSQVGASEETGHNGIERATRREWWLVTWARAL